MLLALDTATATASIAVYDLSTASLLAEWTWQARRRHTQDLLVNARTLLDEMAVRVDDLTALAVTTGPGSFTGVRIGISTVKGLALGMLSMPAVVGMPTLSVTAAPWLAPAAACTPQVTICACIQAGRGRYNWVLFPAAEPVLCPARDEHGAGTAADFAQTLGQTESPIWLVGEIGADLRTAVAPLSHVLPLGNTAGLRRAGLLAELAAQRLAQGVQDDLNNLQPLYLRDVQVNSP